MPDLSRLLRPKSIAAFGGVWADTVVEQAQNLGFEGQIYRIHKSKGSYADLDALPTPPDAIFLGINAHASVEVVAQARKLGAGGVVCFAGGFDELGTQEGRALGTALRDAAGEMPIVGPNCYGIANFFDRAALFPDQLATQSPDRGVFVASQSGTIALNLMYADRDLPLGYLLSIGNQAQLKIHDYIDAALCDPRVSAIGAYLEDIPDPQAFADAAIRAAKAEIPIVLLKSGRSATAKKTALTHTGAMAGSERVMDAFFARLGIARCESLPEFIETLKLLHIHGPLRDARLGALAPSGGDVAISADIAAGLDIDYAKMPAELACEISEHMGGRVSVSNPFDFQTQNWHDADHLYQMYAKFCCMEAGVFALQLDHPDPEDYDASSFEMPVKAYLRAVQDLNVCAITISHMPESTPKRIRSMLCQGGVAPMQGMKEAFQALSQAHGIYRAWQNLRPPRLFTDRPKHRELLGEHGAKTLLEKSGIAVPLSRVVPCAKAADAAKSIGFPVVVKTAHQTLLHKSESGGVALNLNTRDAVSKAALAMQELDENVLVEQMVTDRVAELILGVEIDQKLGAVLMIGAGGLFAELLSDTCLLLLPVSRDDIQMALSKLKVSKLWQGHRGRPLGDEEALISAIERLAQLVTENPNIGNIDINPLAVLPKGKGVVALDAVIEMSKEKAYE